MSADPSPKRPMRETWSRTALVGLAGVGGLTVLGLAGVLAGQLTGSDLVALAGTYAAILGTVAGRAQTGGKGEP
jgi:hypothetical protein